MLLQSCESSLLPLQVQKPVQRADLLPDISSMEPEASSNLGGGGSRALSRRDTKASLRTSGDGFVGALWAQQESEARRDRAKVVNWLQVYSYILHSSTL